MRHLAPFAVLYVVVAVLILPGSPLAAEEVGGNDQGPEQPVPAEQPAPPAQDAVPSDAPSPPPASSLEPGRGAQPEPVQPLAKPQPAAPEQAAASKLSAPAVTSRKRRAPAARSAAATSVTIKDFSFGPASITVNVGDSVTWTNQGPAGHSATARDGSFDTGVLSKGASGLVTFRDAGTFSYICTPHPFMKGAVRVVAASSPSGGNSDSTSSDSSGASGSTGASASSDSGGSGSGESLPNSGGEARRLAASGLLLLALGLAARLGAGRRRGAR